MLSGPLVESGPLGDLPNCGLPACLSLVELFQRGIPFIDDFRRYAMLNPRFDNADFSISKAAQKWRRTENSRRHPGISRARCEEIYGGDRLTSLSERVHTLRVGMALFPELGIHLGSGIVAAVTSPTIGAILLLLIFALLTDETDGE